MLHGGQEMCKNFSGDSTRKKGHRQGINYNKLYKLIGILFLSVSTYLSTIIPTYNSIIISKYI